MGACSRHCDGCCFLGLLALAMTPLVRACPAFYRARPGTFIPSHLSLGPLATAQSIPFERRMCTGRQVTLTVVHKSRCASAMNGRRGKRGRAASLATMWSHCELLLGLMHILEYTGEWWAKEWYERVRAYAIEAFDTDYGVWRLRCASNRRNR